MLIIIAHRILIGTAICFGVFYTVWEALAYRETGELTHLAIAIITAVIQGDPATADVARDAALKLVGDEKGA